MWRAHDDDASAGLGVVAVAAALHGGAGDVVMLDYEPAALHCALLGARASGARFAAAEGDIGASCLLPRDGGALRERSAAGGGEIRAQVLDWTELNFFDTLIDRSIAAGCLARWWRRRARRGGAGVPGGRPRGAHAAGEVRRGDGGGWRAHPRSEVRPAPAGSPPGAQRDRADALQTLPA